MPALTHGRVQNGFNGHATNTQRCTQLINGKKCGGVCCSGGSLQPLKANGGGKPKRNFKAKYNAQVNAPNALPNSIGVSTTIKRANALRSSNGGKNPGCNCLPHQTFSKPRQASKGRQVSLIRSPPPWNGIYTITVGEWSGVPNSGYMGINFNTLPAPFGSVSPPDPTNLFSLVLGTLTDLRVFVDVNIPGWPPAPFGTLRDIKITNVTNNESQVFAIIVDTAGVGIYIADTWLAPLALWAVNDIVTVEILN